MAGPLTWTITGVQPTTGLDVNRQPAKGQNVSYQLSDGTSGTLFIPDEQFNPSQVASLVQAHATNVTTVKGLTGTVQGVS